MELPGKTMELGILDVILNDISVYKDGLNKIPFVIPNPDP